MAQFDGSQYPILPISCAIMVFSFLVSVIFSLVADYLYDLYLVKYSEEKEKQLIQDRVKSDFTLLKNFFKGNKIEKFDDQEAKMRLTIIQKLLNEKIYSKENNPFKYDMEEIKAKKEKIQNEKTNGKVTNLNENHHVEKMKKFENKETKAPKPDEKKPSLETTHIEPIAKVENKKIDTTAKVEPKPTPKPVDKVESKPVAKVAHMPAEKTEEKPISRVEPKSVEKVLPKPTVKIEEKKVELKPIEKTEPNTLEKIEQTPHAKVETKIAPKVEPKTTEKTEPKPVAKAEPKTVEKIEHMPIVKAEAKIEPKTTEKTEPKAEPKTVEKIEHTSFVKAETNVAPKVEPKAVVMLESKRAVNKEPVESVEEKLIDIQENQREEKRQQPESKNVPLNLKNLNAKKPIEKSPLSKPTQKIQFTSKPKFAPQNATTHKKDYNGVDSNALTKSNQSSNNKNENNTDLDGSFSEPMSFKASTSIQDAKEEVKPKQVSVDEALSKLALASRSATVYIEIRENGVRQSSARLGFEEKSFSFPKAENSEELEEEEPLKANSKVFSKPLLDAKKPNQPEKKPNPNPFVAPNSELLDNVGKKNPLNKSLSQEYREKKQQTIEEKLKLNSRPIVNPKELIANKGRKNDLDKKKKFKYDDDESEEDSKERTNHQENVFT